MSTGSVTSKLDLPRLDGLTTSPKEVAKALLTHGCVVVENLVDPSIMKQLQKDLNHSDGVFHGDKGSFAGEATTRNAGKPLGESKLAQDLAEHPLIVQAVRLRLQKWCRRFVLGTCSNINVAPPQNAQIPTAPPQVLHRDEDMWGASDWNDWIPSTSDDRPEFSISVMWAISEFTPENGATRIIPGSHRWQREGNVSHGHTDDLNVAQSEEKKVEDNSLESLCIPASMPVGSVLLWSGATVHGANCNTSSREDDIRRGLLFIYNLGWLKTEHNFHWAMPADVMATFSPSLLELVGMVGTNKVSHPWFTGPVYAQPLLGSPDDQNDENHL